MNYSESLAWLYSSQRHGIKLGLDNVRRLAAAVGIETGPFPDKPRVIHVAGTNGKGSVCAMIDSICRAQNLRTALFTSPHLVSFRERIKINGELITENEVARILTRIRTVVANFETHPTFFEITTVLALEYFQTQGVEVVVLETGLGGRLDATNIVTPSAAVITNIAFDHQAWLGSTLTEIAAEKAGIIKPGVPVVSAPQSPQAREVLNASAAKSNTTVDFVTEPLARTDIGLVGSHQQLNAAVAIAALAAAKIAVSRAAIDEGLQNVTWPGRFQIDGRLVLDGAHNPAAAQCLAQTWREVFCDEKATVIAGILRDKDIKGICEALVPIASSFMVTPVRSERSSDTAAVREIFNQCAAHLDCEMANDLPHALALARAKPTRVLVTGSLFLIGETLAHLSGALQTLETSAQ